MHSTGDKQIQARKSTNGEASAEQGANPFPNPQGMDEAARIQEIEKRWFTTHRPVPLELLVPTAAELSRDYENHSLAAEAALRLIDTCARLLEHNQSHAEREKQGREIYAALGAKPGENIPFAKGVKFITGQARAARAEEDFIIFLQAQARISRPGDGGEPVAGKFTAWEKHGFGIEELLTSQQLFEEYRGNGLLEKSGDREKKPWRGKTAEISPERLNNLCVKIRYCRISRFRCQ